MPKSIITLLTQLRNLYITAFINLNLSGMKGISPLIASVLLIAITMTLAAILASFVSTYTQQQLAILPTCVGGTIRFSTADYPYWDSTNTQVVAIIDVGGADLKGFKIEAIDTIGDVVANSNDLSGTDIDAGSSATLRGTFASGVGLGNDVRISATNCPDVRTSWAALKSAP